MAGAGEPGAARPGRALPVIAWGLLALALVLWAGELSGGPVPGGLFGGSSSPAGPGVDGLPEAAEPLEGNAPPSVVEIDRIGVLADVIPRGVDATGGVDPPPFEEPGVAGWYEGGPTPGAEGAAVLVGHVDTETQRAVFYALSTVEKGDTVRVTREDGSLAEFTVSEVEVVEREEFDAEHVYGPRLDGEAELRLITCGGSFDRESGAYSANVVVSAYLTGPDRA
ncbi:class F sortase [Streptomyces sp. DSM 44917]|uniref:Class F sortase n=1 Tax=Streptomyces boetiae TaxID=3075541 RepID=A0ABU2L908_9ACTN|nr:class F sortase [Streptomyces sp. DSM 44917]MDT0307822.1 class F sortase [Streptomyces sp. DSM 44917]